MKGKLKSAISVPPESKDRACGGFTTMLAQRDWQEDALIQVKHPELRRNEVFIANATFIEFQWLRVTIPASGDFKSVRMGMYAMRVDGTPIKREGAAKYFPVFGSLKRGARLRRKERKSKK